MCAADQPPAVCGTSSRPHAACSNQSAPQIGAQGFCRQTDRCEATGVRSGPLLQQVGTPAHDGPKPHLRPHLRSA
ncbi:hypothetical protein NDU88_007606 [Pleurodeles waltl]|uniref:Uncharacterized protein n=1 Tax=Pleurodeles waltl TaxID=8319 RepID=A0AAV7N2K6_PLEWA|nr:hypothetical protein NDU88_007606 [Pleurodeles waltl]